MSDHDGDQDALRAAQEALRLAIPVIRRGLWDYLPQCMVRGDPRTIAAAEWDEVADDIRALRAATAIVGPQPDYEFVDAGEVDQALAMAPDA